MIEKKVYMCLLGEKGPPGGGGGVATLDRDTQNRSVTTIQASKTGNVSREICQFDPMNTYLYIVSVLVKHNHTLLF